MTIDWALLLIVGGASFYLGTQYRELNAERFWILERCRRYVLDDSVPFGARQCKNAMWRIRWSSLASLTRVCRDCRKAETKLEAVT